MVFVKLVEKLLHSCSTLELELLELLFRKAKEVGSRIDTTLDLLLDVLAVLGDELPEEVVLSGLVFGDSDAQAFELILSLGPARLYLAKDLGQMLADLCKQHTGELICQALNSHD